MATINRLKSIMHQTVINSSIKGFTYKNVIDAISTAVNASFLKFLKQTKKNEFNFDVRIVTGDCGAVSSFTDDCSISLPVFYAEQL